MALHAAHEPLQDVRAAHVQALRHYHLGEELSPMEIVRRSLSLANEGISLQEMQLSLDLALNGSSRPRRHTKSNEEFVRNAWLSCAEEAKGFRHDLEVIMKNRTQARQLLEKKIDSALKQVVVVPRLIWTGDELRTELFYCWNDIVDLCNLVLLYLLDRRMNLAAALRICKYDACDRIFLSFPPSSGGPRPSYCSPQHRIESTKQLGAARVALYRKKVGKRKPVGLTKRGRG